MRYAPLIEASFEVTQKSGDEWLCMCPWHADTSPGHLYANAVKGLYVCFSCHKKGRLDDLGQLPLQTTNGLRDRLQRMHDAKQQPEQRYYPEGWLKQFDVPHPYWTDTRGLSDETVQRFRLGYDPFSNRVTLPLRDVRGRILGVTYRRLDDGRPKYLHPKGFPIGRHLYGSWLLTDERKVALVEGQVDAVACWEARIPALALMGSRITKDQVQVLQRADIQTVVLALDNDSAGIRGTLAVHDALQGTGIKVQGAWYRPYWNVKDPDGLNPQRLRKFYHSAVGMMEWVHKTGYMLT